VRVGNWLTAEEGKKLLGAESADTLRSRRNRALLSLLIGCGLRRAEVTTLRFEDFQLREGRWVIADLRGKGGHIRTIPVPAWVKHLDRSPLPGPWSLTIFAQKRHHEGMVRLNWPVWSVDLLRLLTSFVLAFPIGWNREREDRSAGVRTFPLVSMGSCGLILMASRLIGNSGDIESRVLQGLITGIGFIGGGAILKQEKIIHGTATAASVWNMAVIGAATGFGYYDIAVILALINLLTLRLLGPLKKQIDQR
jgi:putative Mg2+ transporter-C (MgtC) family protein